MRRDTKPETHILEEAIDLLFPYSCSICNKYSDVILFGTHVCKSCLRQFNPIDKENRWQFCLSEPFSGDKYPKLPLYVPFAYSGVVSRSVQKLKFAGEEDLGRLLGGLLGQAAKQDDICVDLVTSVPLSEERLSERGYNQASIIARELSGIISTIHIDNILKRTKLTMRQTECKTNEDRIANVSGAFVINSKRDISNMRILLVDDVATTGNTLREAAGILQDNGAKVLCCAFASNRSIKNVESY